MTDRFDIELALDMLLSFHELGEDNNDPHEVTELVELMRERHNEIVDVLSDPSP